MHHAILQKSAAVLAAAALAAGLTRLRRRRQLGRRLRRRRGATAGRQRDTRRRADDHGRSGTTLTLSDGAAGALDAVGRSPGDGGAGVQARGHAVVPIERGRVDVDTLSGQIDHDGGVRLSVAGQDLVARELVVDPGRGRITAEVAGARIQLMAVDFGRPRQAPTSDTIVLDGRAATLTPEVLERLGGRIGAQALGEGLRLGRVQVSAQT